VDVEVVNLGAGGYRSGQVLQLIEQYVLPLEPDFLLVDCMPGDDVRLRRTYPSGSESLARVLFYSRVYRLLRLGVGWVRDEPLGPVGDVRIEPRAGQMVPGGGNHEEILALAAAAGVPLWFLDYPFVGSPGEAPARALAPANALPEGAQVISSTPRLLASGLTGPQLFLDNNHLTREGSRLVGEAAADVLEGPLRAALP